MYYNKVEISGVNTSKLTVLKEKEKLALLNEFRETGNKEAREKLICGNLRLVLSCLQKFMNRGENPDDLFQVGVIGLIKAIDNFDTSLMVKFSTYCVPTAYTCRKREVQQYENVEQNRINKGFRDYRTF